MKKKQKQNNSVTHSQKLPTLPPWDQWPIRFLVASDQPEILELILSRYLTAEQNPRFHNNQKQMNPVLLEIVGRKQAGIILWRIEQVENNLELNPSTRQILAENTEIIKNFKQLLQAYRPSEMAGVANRKLAMQELDKRAGEMDIKPIIIKGGATSQLYYPKETMRSSSDIDILLSKTVLRNFIPEDAGYSDQRHDAGQYNLMGFNVEAHQFVGSDMKWGLYEDVKKHSQVAASYPNLLFPDQVDTLFIALRHYTVHAGEMPWDLLDCSLLLAQDATALNKLIDRFFEQRTMTMLAMAPLVILAHLKMLESSTIETIYNELSIKDKKLLQKVINHHFQKEHSSFRNNYLSAKINNINWLVRGLNKIFYYKDMVKEKTGYSYSHPLFWFHYLMTYPFWRLVGCVNKKYNKTYR